MNRDMERRRDPRVQVKVRMEMTDGETGRTHVLLTTNLSSGGARCTALTAPRPGAKLQGHMFLPLSEAGRDVDVAIAVTARVVRVDRCAQGSGDEFSLAFDPMAEVDRAELASYLYAWLADDCFIHVTSEVEAMA
jgi:c-di-GMP-binding flagellar brake protein YcgR